MAGIVQATTNTRGEMAETETYVGFGGEQAKVESWRLHVLIEAGYPLALAEKLAASAADLHLCRAAQGRPLSHHGRRDPALRARLCSPGPGGSLAPTNTSAGMAKVEALRYGDRKVYAVSAFNRGVAGYVARPPRSGSKERSRRRCGNTRWASVFFTLKDSRTGACLLRLD